MKRNTRIHCLTRPAINSYHHRTNSIAQANRVTQVTASRDGSAVFFTTYGEGGYILPALRRITPGGKVVTMLASLHYGDGTGANAGIETPGGIAATPDGKVIYVSEPGKKVIRKVVIGN